MPLIIKRYPGQRLFIGDSEVIVSNVKGREISLMILTPRENDVSRPSKEEDRAARDAWKRRRGILGTEEE